MSHQQPHSAAELISTALQKIKRFASNRKYAKLSQECGDLLNNLHEVLSPQYASQAAVSIAKQSESRQLQHEASLTAEPSEETFGVAQQASVSVASPAAETEANGTSEQQSDVASSKSAVAGSTVQQAADNIGSESLTKEPDSSAEAGSQQAQSDAEAAAAAASQAAAAAAKEKQDADAARLAAVAASASESAPKTPKTDSAISDAAAMAVLRVLNLAVETARPNIVEVTLDLVHKLIAFRYLQGAAYTVTMEKRLGGDTEASSKADGADSAAHTPQALAVELICRCDEIPDENVEVLVLRGLLTATTSCSFLLHNQALLLAVRTCYNIYLMSRSEVNQTTAKATLTQMLNVVFQRMEADSVLVQVKPIVVADVLGLPKANASDANSITTAVQNFLNNVVAAAGYSQIGLTSEELKSSVAGAFDRHNSLTAAAPATAAAAGPSSVASVESDEDEDERFKLGDGTSTPKSGGRHSSQPSTPKQTSTPKAHKSSTAAAAAQAAVSSSPHAPPTSTAGPAAAAANGSVTAPLLKDAFLVFRALCKLSIRTSDTVTVSDPTAVRGKLLALELLKVLLENSGPAFRASDRFTAAIRQYLCLSLLKNSSSSIPQALQLSASIFLSLLQRFRQALKAEVGVFFPMIMLKALEPPVGAAAGGPGAAAPTNIAVNAYSYKVVVLRCLREVCANGQLLVDLFVNYDCDLGSSNLFERLINGLVKMAQNPLAPGLDHTQIQQEQWLRQEALQCLSSAAEALLHWYRGHTGGQGSADDRSDDGRDDATATVPRNSSQSLLHLNHSASSLATADDATASSSGSGAGATETGGDLLTRKRAYKEKFQEGIALFNKKPKKGIALLQAGSMLGNTPEDIALFLAKTEGLDKVLIGDYLGEREDMNLKVMHAYVDAMQFEAMEFDTAIRTFLQGFRLPGEAQKIDRLMEKFAERYVKCNPASFKSADVAYVLAYSVIMLNTDAHNPQVKKKMTCEDFLKNNRGINDGQDLPPDFMRALYERITTNEIKMKDDALVGGQAGDAGKGDADSYLRGNVLVNVLWSIVGGHKQQVSAEPTDDAIKRTLDHLHDRAKGATYFTATELDTVRPMLELIWAPLLGCFSVLFDEYSDPRLLTICLNGFSAAACLAAELGVSNLRDIFINSLCNFTHLHSPGTMKPKNGLAFKYLLRVAQQVGDHLEERWLEVLRCISRWELLQQIASGMPTDAVLFAAPHEKGIGKAAAALKDQLRKLSATGPPGGGPFHQLGGGGGGGDAAGANGGGIKSMDTLAMSEVSIKRAHIGASGREEDHVVPQDIINSVDTAELNKVYMASAFLDSDAVVHFVRALASISQDELRDATAPRVFSLTKIVEIAHFNMTRIRLVWSRIWAVLSEYFIAVGCHANLAVAMYAVDSLRQLAMKFLERDELANYTFQNDFLRPFVVVMRQSQAIVIRELIIRCLSQMVLARVNNVKSGWKSMFMVFTTAAGDSDPTIVRLAFDTIEKIVREHFGHITETETTTFTDCVNCLIAFTNNPHSLEVALNSIAFLRFCASRLAEGAIGELAVALPEGVDADKMGPTRVVSVEDRSSSLTSALRTPSATANAERAGCSSLASSTRSAGHHALKFVDRDEHVYFWFPLLAGLSELTFDPRQEIRHGALEVLFDTLKGHGGTFAESFWARIFDSVLLPIFDHVRAEVTDTTTFTSERRRQQEDSWLYETCTRCLQHLVDLFGQYYSSVQVNLGRLLELLAGFIARSHASLASVGVAGLVRLVDSCGEMMDEQAWQQVMATLRHVIHETLPDAHELVTPPQRPSAAGQEAAPAVAGSSTPTSAAPFPIHAAGHSGQQQHQQQTAAQQLQPQPSSQPRPPYTLREGIGMRRLLKFRVKASVQLLLVQATSEMYAAHNQHIKGSAVMQLVEGLDAMSSHARRINTDLDMRRRLAAQQADDRVPEDRTVPDPPLLRQETEASHAYLSVLLHMSSSNAVRAQQAADQDQIQARMVQLAFNILQRFSLGAAITPSTSSAVAATTSSTLSSRPSTSMAAAGGRSSATAAPVGMAAPSVEYLAFGPLVVSTLKTVGAFEESVFRQQLPKFFPILVQLIRSDYAQSDVQRTLSDLFLTRLGPLLGSNGVSGHKAA